MAAAAGNPPPLTRIRCRQRTGRRATASPPEETRLIEWRVRRRAALGKVIAEHSISLDGFSTGPNVTPGDPLGAGGEQLHEWMFPAGGLSGTNARVAAEMFESSGAVIVGRRMFDLGVEPWGDDPPFHMPVFVVTHRQRAALPKRGGTTYHFVMEGIERTLDLAKEAARGKDVAIEGGADVVRQFLAKGLIDELRIHIVPVLLGSGTRLFGEGQHTELELSRAVDGPGVTHLTFRVPR